MIEVCQKLQVVGQGEFSYLGIEGVGIYGSVVCIVKGLYWGRQIN